MLDLHWQYLECDDWRSNYTYTYIHTHASARVCVCYVLESEGGDWTVSLRNLFLSLMADEPLPTRWSFQVPSDFLNSVFKCCIYSVRIGACTSVDSCIELWFSESNHCILFIFANAIRYKGSPVCIAGTYCRSRWYKRNMKRYTLGFSSCTWIFRGENRTSVVIILALESLWFTFCLCFLSVFFSFFTQLQVLIK